MALLKSLLKRGLWIRVFCVLVNNTDILALTTHGITKRSSHAHHMHSLPVCRSYLCVKRYRTSVSSSIREEDYPIDKKFPLPFDLKTSSKVNDDVLHRYPISHHQGFSSWGNVISRVLSTSFLIAGNTVGASMMELPNAVSQAGISASAFIFLGSYVINLISALYLIDFSISKYEAGRPASDIPISFKDIADEAFGPSAGYAVATVSVLFNWCALIFSILTCGSVAHALVPALDPKQISLIFSALLALFHVKLSNNALSQVASVGVLALFASFAALVVPAMMHSDCSSLLSTMGSASTVTSEALLIAGPCIVFSMVFQNIVPIAAKLCNFDRFQTTASVILGSALPTIMYMSWCAAVLAGGIDVSTVNSMFLPIFLIATVGGSSIGSVMSTAEEFETLLEPLRRSANNGVMNQLLQQGGTSTADENIVIEDKKDYFFSTASVLLATIPPALACLSLGATGNVDDGGSGVMKALDVAGGYCSPFLCWLFPAFLHRKLLEHQEKHVHTITGKNVFSWGSRQASSAYVTFCALLMLEQQLMKDFSVLGNLDVFASIFSKS
jgi:hypothetical protein